MDTTGTDFHAFAVSFPDVVEQEFSTAYGAERWAKIKHKLALPPKYTGVRVNTVRTTRADVIAALGRELAPFNARLEAAGREQIHPTAHPLLDDAVVIPSAAPVTSPAPISYCADLRSIIVDRLCGEAVLRGSDIFARGVMSASSGLNAGDRVNIFVDLDHISTRGSDVNEHKGRKLFIAQGTVLMVRGEMFRAMRGLAITDITRVCADAPPMNGVLAGDIYVQNLPSTVVAHALDPQEGDVIIDMCAAPGGKTSHVATLMKNKGILIACDQSKRKVIELKKLFTEQLPFDIVTPLRLDSMHSVVPKTDGPVLSVQQVLDQAKASTPADAPLLKVAGFYPETFDKILLDPPCSALGLRPRLLHAGDSDDLAIFSNMQRNFLWCASLLLKPGGTLVYSTCTINPSENEQMVRYALDNFPLKLVKQDIHIGDSGLLNQGLREEEAALVQRFDPSNETLDTMGFFVAKFIKTRSSREKE